jgi:predicted MFS family arabinose efflux permease
MSAALPSSSAPDAGTAGPSSRYAEYVLWLLTLVYVVNFVDRQILSILLQAIKEDLGLADSQLGLLSGTAFGIFYATLGIPIARVADRWSRKGVVVASLALWSGMTVLCGTASGFATLLLYRIGVGVGEAGCSPPAHSLITDYFPLERRGRALGIFTLGVPAGILVGFLLGGWLEEEIGWRRAFWVVGAPGLLLSLVVWGTLREPSRPTSEGRMGEAGAEGGSPALRDVIRFLARHPSFRMISLGAGLYSFVGYSVVNWMPSLLIRSYAMGTQEVGTWLSLIIGVGGCLGTFGGGWLGDRWAVSDPRGRMWLPSAAMAISLPFSFLIYTADTGTDALVWLILPATLGLMWQAPSYGLAQSLATPKTRATASALVLFVTNIIGLALGPAVTGLLSDLLEPRFGVDSLRWAMLAVSTMLGPAAWCFFSASRTMAVDMENARLASAREARGETLDASSVRGTGG